MCFSARPQVELVLGIGLLLYLVIKIKETRSWLAIAAVLAGIFLGSIGTSGSAGSSILEDPGAVISIIVENPAAVISIVDGVPTSHAANQVAAASVI